MKRVTTLLAGLCVAVACAGARGGEIEDQTIPGKWLAPLLPEDAPEPEYPDYDKNNLLEKARLQVEAGQYRRALVALELAGNGKPIDTALIGGQARLELGRYDEALAGLTLPDPGVQTLRARVLAAEADYEGAIGVLRKVISTDSDLIAPHYYLGDCLEKAGDFDGTRGRMRGS